MTINKEVVKKYLLAAGIVILLLVVFNPAKTTYASVEENYFASVKHDAEVVGNKKLATADNKILLDYGRGVCDTLNTKGKSGDDAVAYLANEAFTTKNSPDENLELVSIVISNAVRHLCPAYIGLLD